jgi:hypothetical protein
MGLVTWSAIWIYVLANLAGGALAAVAFRFASVKDAPVDAIPLQRVVPDVAEGAQPAPAS